MSNLRTCSKLRGLSSSNHTDIGDTGDSANCADSADTCDTANCADTGDSARVSLLLNMVLAHPRCPAVRV